MAKFLVVHPVGKELTLEIAAPIAKALARSARSKAFSWSNAPVRCAAAWAKPLPTPAATVMAKAVSASARH